LNYVTQGNPNREQVTAAVPAGIYIVRVLYQRPLGPQAFILTMNHRGSRKRRYHCSSEAPP
jgi:hypothetical protein